MRKPVRIVLAAVAAALLVVIMAVGWSAPAEAAPAAPDVSTSVEAPAHIPWPGFSFDVCDYARASHGYHGWTTYRYFTVHYGAHVVYCGITIGAANDVCFQVIYEYGITQDWHTEPAGTCW